MPLELVEATADFLSPSLHPSDGWDSQLIVPKLDGLIYFQSNRVNKMVQLMEDVPSFCHWSCLAGTGLTAKKTMSHRADSLTRELHLAAVTFWQWLGWHSHSCSMSKITPGYVWACICLTFGFIFLASGPLSCKPFGTVRFRLLGQACIFSRPSFLTGFSSS